MDFKKLPFLHGFFVVNAALSCYGHTGFTKSALSNAVQLNEKSFSKTKKDFIKDTIADAQIWNNSLSLVTIPIVNDTSSWENLTYEHTTVSAFNKEITQNVFRDDVSCTCGIFLSSQFSKESAKVPKGQPVISNTLEKKFVCTPIGKKQCQTKCLEQIVRHLPNSASILCASLDRDIHKERAYLFVRNCSSKWYNTNLGAGREYCCKNGLPYNCSKNRL